MMSGRSADERRDIEQFFKYYEICRTYVLAESTLIGNRLNWILTINGFMMTASGLIFKSIYDGDLHNSDFSVLNHGPILCIFAIICVVGVIVNYYGSRTIEVAQSAGAAVDETMKIAVGYKYKIAQFEFQLQRKFRTERRKANYILIKGYPVPGIRGGGDTKNVDHGHAASRRIPQIFLGMWLIFAGIGIWQAQLSLSVSAKSEAHGNASATKSAPPAPSSGRPIVSGAPPAKAQS